MPEANEQAGSDAGTSSPIVKEYQWQELCLRSTDQEKLSNKLKELFGKDKDCQVRVQVMEHQTCQLWNRS